MYLHFQNWSSVPSIEKSLDALQLPHQGEVVKVFSSPDDPRVGLGRPALHVVEVGGEAFAGSETYEYGDRRTYRGPELEEELASYDLSQMGMDIARSLFRFSHHEGFCHAAMAARREDDWVIEHPLETIDGIKTAGRAGNERAMHLDIFLPGSLRKVLGSVDYRDPDTVVSWEDGIRWLQAA